MTGRPWRIPLLAALLVVGLALAKAPPVLASEGPCPGSTGVTVVVDFQALGGGIVTRCAPGAPASGFKALTAAGFSIEEVRNVPGFLCRINGQPTPGQDTCVSTPPASAYWSYWHAARGGNWVTSQEGGKTRRPPVGSVDGWSFSDDGSPGAASPPGIAPPAPPPSPATPRPPTAAPSTPKPATPRPATPRPATPKPGTPGPTTPSPDGSGTPAISPAGSASTGSTSPASVGPIPSGSLASSAAVAATPELPQPSTGLGDGIAAVGGPPVGTLLAIGLVILVGGAALVVGRRRPSGGPGG